MLPRTAHLLALLLAVLGGVVPLRVCCPSDGSRGGVTSVGHHVHDASDEDPCEPAPGDPQAPDGHEQCCADVPFDLGAPFAATHLDLPAPRVLVGAPPDPPRAARCDVPRASGGSPPTETTVLLR